MSLNYILIWMVIFSAVTVTIQTFRLGLARFKSWFLVMQLILLITGALVLLRPQIAGYVGGGLWLAFFLTPFLVIRTINRAIIRQDFSQADFLARLLFFLHPFPEMRSFPRILSALKLIREGKWRQAQQTLEKYQSTTSRLGRLAATILYRTNHNWEDFVKWVRHAFSDGELKGDGDMIVLVVRALGEVGDPCGMLRFYQTYRNHIEATGEVNQSLALLFVFAFTGERELVEKLFHGVLASFPDYVKTFWLATADMARGRAGQAEALLQGIDEDVDVSIRRGIMRRTSFRLPDAQKALDGAAREILKTLANDFEQQQRFGESFALLRPRPYATYVLAGLICLVFLAEILLGGSENPFVLVFLGGVIPDVVVGRNHWWRLVAANFLHYGWLHLAMNLIALFYLGPFVEYALGRLRYVVCYLASGIFGLLMAVLLFHFNVLGYQIIVGASGCIMGLVGATAAIVLRGWKQRKSSAAFRRLEIVGLIIAFQVIFDLATPEVSFTVHTGGLVIGFAVAGLMRHGFNQSTRSINVR